MVNRCVVTCCLALIVLAGHVDGVRDLLILLDDSASIPDAEWAYIKDDLVDLINMVCGGVGPASISSNRLAIATFSSTVQLRFDMTDFTKRPQYVRAIRNMGQTKGTDRCLGRALNFATELFEGLPYRQGQIREVLILTGSGATNCPSHSVDFASAIGSLRAQAFVFGLNVGGLTPQSRRLIESLVSKPFIDHIFSLPNFINFHEMVNTLKQYPSFCVPFYLS